MNPTQFFDVGGPLSRAVGGMYIPRTQQMQLADRVFESMRDSKHLFAEGPTGTGKSFSYLAASALTRRRTIVVTSNISLQEQLVAKDLPAISRAMELVGESPIRFCLMKGRNNYVCKDMIDSLKIDMDPETQRIVEWAKRTTTGDVSELDFIPRPDDGGRLFVTSERCLGSECIHADSCWANIANKKAWYSDVIVTNYHLFFAHLQVRMVAGKDIVLPPASFVVLDEAHCGVDIARDFFGWQYGETAVKRLVKAVERQDADASNELAIASRMFFARATTFRESPAYRGRLSPGMALPFDSLTIALGRAEHVMSDAVAACDPTDSQTIIRLAQYRDNAKRMCSAFTDAQQCKNPKFVYFLEKRSERAQSVSVCGKPFKVNEELRDLLFAKFQSVTAVSATMRVGGSFKHIREEYGVPETADELAVTSPFDLKANALCVVPNGPDPSAQREEFSKHVSDRVVEIVSKTRGRALCLFSSHKQLNAAHEALLRAKVPYRILKQGDRPRTQLLEDFKTDTHSILLGAASFWAGVDVPGESLSCVIVDKIPFLPPDDPVMLAMGESGFMSYSLPKAALEISQAFGRLIRTTTDRGVVVLLDPRLRSKGYGNRILKSLPLVTFSGDVNSIDAFFGNTQSQVSA